MVRKMVKGFIIMLMEEFTRECGQMMRYKALEFKKEIFTIKESGLKVDGMEKDF